MSKSRKNRINTKILESLDKLDIPLIDIKRNIQIYFKDKSRSNETGKEHIARKDHGLKVSDIELVKLGINKPFIFKQDFKHSGGYTYYIKRKTKPITFIKISINLFKDDKNKAYIKTMYITKKINR